MKKTNVPFMYSKNQFIKNGQNERLQKIGLLQKCYCICNNASMSFTNRYRLLTGISLLIIAMLTSPGTQAQNLQWAKGFSNANVLGGAVYVSDIKKDAAGNNYVTGNFTRTVDLDPGSGVASFTSAGNGDIFFAKYDVDGNYLFAKTFGNVSDDNGASIDVDASGNIYITGYFQGTVDFDPGAATANLVSNNNTGDIFFAKYNASGNYVFAKGIGGTDYEEGKKIVLDASGNIYIAGYYASTVDFDPGAGTANLTSTGSYELYFAKYDGSGNYIYAKSMGGASSDEVRGLAVDAAQNVYITGYFYLTADFDPGAGVANLTAVGAGDAFIAKYDASGNYVFAKQIGGTGSDIGTGIVTDASGNIYVIINFYNTVDFDPSASTANLISKGYYDMAFAKYDGSGNYLFAKSVGSTNSDIVNGLALDASGNIYITGVAAGVIDFDPSSAVANAAFAGVNDIFFAKYNATGDYVFAYTVGGTGNDYGSAIAVGASGNIAVAARFEATADFDPSSGTQNVVSGSGISNGVIAQYNSSGTYLWASGLGRYDGTTLTDKGRDIAIDASGNTYVLGTFQGTVDFDPGPGVTNLTSVGGDDIFVTKFNPNGGLVFAFALGGTSTELGTSICVSSTGTIGITGSFRNTIDFDPGAGTANLTSAGGTDIFYARYDASGNYLSAVAIGGTGSEVANGIAIDASGNIIISGSYSGTIDFDPSAGVTNLVSTGSTDIFLAKYSSAGSLLFAKTLGGTSADVGYRLVTDATGNIYLTGSFTGTANFNPAGTANLTSLGGTDVFVAKYDASGNYVFAKSQGTANVDVGYGIALDASQNICIAGSYNGSSSFGGRVTGAAVLLYDIFFSKYDASGNLLFSNTLASSGDDMAYDVVTDASSNIFVTGYFSGTIDFDPGAGTSNLVSTGATDIFMAKYDASGNYIFARKLGSYESDYGYAITVDATGNAYFTGAFSNTVNFDPGSGTSNLVSPNSLEVYVARFGLVALPVNFTSFKAVPVGKGTIQVSWTTASELQNNYFEIERSTDGVVFETIGTVKGCGTCSYSQSYSFDDTNPYEGTSYYRVKQVDVNGAYAYTGIATVATGTQSSVSLKILNNPTIQNGVLEISNVKQSGMANIELLSYSGAIIRQIPVQLNAGVNHVTVNLAGQQAGIYVIRISDEKHSFRVTARLVKQ